MSRWKRNLLSSYLSFVFGDISPRFIATCGGGDCGLGVIGLSAGLGDGLC